jgi:HK97 family phage major capsid protein
MEITQKELEKIINDKIAKLTDVSDKRPNDQDTNKDIPSGLSFQDQAGVIHKAYGSGEKLFTGGEDFNVGKIIRAKIVGNYEGLNDVEVKAAGEGTGALGGWLVPETVSAKIIDLARNFARVMQAGAYTIPMTSPEMKLVKIEGDPTAYFKAEHAAITESDK